MRAPARKTITEASRLSGPEKAAVVLLSLGEEHAQVWQSLEEEEIKEISQAMAGLGNSSWWSSSRPCRAPAPSWGRSSGPRSC
jgi:flagellar motor switch protein FliG